MTTATRYPAMVRRGSMGGFLDPPGYPTREYEVVTGIYDRAGRRRMQVRPGSGEYYGCLSVEFVFDAEGLSEGLRRQCAELIAHWYETRPPIGDPLIQAWIAHCLGYFRGCYRGVDDGRYGRGQWAVESLTIDQRDPIVNQDDHAAVHLIRKFYPEYMLSPADLDRAHWGNHPEHETTEQRAI